MQNTIPNLVKHFGRSPWSEPCSTSVRTPLAPQDSASCMMESCLKSRPSRSLHREPMGLRPAGRGEWGFWLCDLCARFYVLRCDGQQVTASPLQLEKGLVSAPIPIKKTVGSEGLRVMVRPSLLMSADHLAWRVIRRGTEDSCGRISAIFFGRSDE